MNRRKQMCTIWTLLVSICGLIALIGADDMDPNDEMARDIKPGVGLTSYAVNSLQDSEQVLVEPLLQFSSNLFRAVRQEKENAILSPVSVHSALNLLLLGAESKTQTELVRVLGYSQSNRSPNKVHESYSKLLAIFKQITAISLKYHQCEKSNSRLYSDEKPPVLDVWTMAIGKGDFKPKPEYVKEVQRYYNSSIRELPQGRSDAIQKLADEINKWARDAGYNNGVITTNDLEEEFSLLLLSAVRVQAFWFDEFETRVLDDAFYNHGLQSGLVKNSTVLYDSDVRGKFAEFTQDSKSKYNYFNVQLQSKNPTLYQELANLEFRAIEVPLVGNLSFTILEPLKSASGHDLNKLEDQLLAVDQGDGTQSKLAKALRLIDSPESKHRIDYLSFPQFKFESDIDLKKSLISLGLKRAFEKEAEFYKISSPGLYVSQAKHQAVIDVNKHGIKAAGITQIKMVPLSLRIPRYPIRIQFTYEYELFKSNFQDKITLQGLKIDQNLSKLIGSA